ncbi:hypothetical protein BDP55DRAFT_631112 [Colletotrichum godetiae]|uniref:Uncharacterized protein n=1 Tax=Colletotrichum godetiae TaxID=1209918 RepID=A0AAJ0AQ44_9PEZI|nr:uncharacterized protein BDP55DRAFT_631112 [Colletotrichum godetiae]KAK1676472.1 hypothetical protein BDP55DRAFT_631112 [Colletotrichum godetiae]
MGWDGGAQGTTGGCRSSIRHLIRRPRRLHAAPVRPGPPNHDLGESKTGLIPACLETYDLSRAVDVSSVVMSKSTANQKWRYPPRHAVSKFPIGLSLFLLDDILVDGFAHGPRCTHHALSALVGGVVEPPFSRAKKKISPSPPAWALSMYNTHGPWHNYCYLLIYLNHGTLTAGNLSVTILSASLLGSVIHRLG